MSEKKTIFVTGATGAQGGSVADFLLKSGKYSVRALTRKAGSDKAKTLADKGAEIIEGTLDNAESLSEAMKGCYGVFGVTSFWEHFNKEFEHGQNLVNAVKQNNIQHFVFSTLPNAKKISNGKYVAPHLDIKGDLEDYSKSLEIKATYLHVAFYYDNFLSFFPPQKGTDDTFSFGFPQHNNLRAIAIEDLGGIVLQIFEHPEMYIGKTVFAAGDALTPEEYAKVMSEVLNKKVTFNFIPQEVFAGFGFPGADDLAAMFAFQQEFFPPPLKDADECRKIYPQLRTFKQWMEQNKDKFDFMN
ncbi:MAG TPA: NmrA/HSCARG family protein [Ignavibacteria bacterium]|nr:NmrA/HSCARG family protein [Ignavibacteria bacterium]